VRLASSCWRRRVSPTRIAPRSKVWQAGYARALGSCAAEEYADLFAPEVGYFASGIRGEVVGRERLIALVRSERQCTGATPPAAPRRMRGAPPRRVRRPPS
jgi:hypothetical protein